MPSIAPQPDAASNDPRREQWALPYETASAEARAAHMCSAHHILLDDAHLHADMHSIGWPPHPHQHMTVQQAAGIVEGGE